MTRESVVPSINVLGQLVAGSGILGSERLQPAVCVISKLCFAIEFARAVIFNLLGHAACMVERKLRPRAFRVNQFFQFFQVPEL